MTKRNNTLKNEESDNKMNSEETVTDLISTDPVIEELTTSSSPNNLPPAPSPEEIAVSMQEKLSQRSNEQGFNPFVPGSQLENEVKGIASQQGFPLSRGTEVGARLMARANRVM